MKVVLVMFKDGKRRDFPVTKPKTIIGRRSDADLRIPTGDVSREHCTISLNGRDLTVRDNGSTNGTFVNGKQLAEARLKAGDKLSVGPVVFTVQIDGMPPTIKPEPPPSKPVPSAKAAAEDDLDDILDLDDLEFDEDDGPMSPVDGMDDDEDDKPAKGKGKKP